MATAEGAAKAGWKAVKDNWIFFVVLALVLGALVLWWDKKKAGALTAKLASLPVIGKFFASVALLLGAGRLLGAIARALLS
jgi:type II secretory pathway component PulF